jgi:hypothetical protein
MRPPPIEYNYLGLREWLLGCILSNPELSKAGSPEDVAHRAILMTDAVMKELHSGDHHTTDPSLRVKHLIVPPPLPPDSDAPPTTPHTPSSKDKLRAVTAEQIALESTKASLDWEGARYSFYDLYTEDLKKSDT